MAMFRRSFNNAALVTPIVDPFKWVEKKVPAGRIKVAKTVIAKYDPGKWLLSHATIMASVDTELANPKDKKSKYFIKPEHSIFVNNNGDAWERELLRATYKTFLGADNYLEHCQLPELSKGKVIDVALREVPIGKDRDGKDITTLYVDLLIATSREHEDLVEKIKTGYFNATSMGCQILFSQCSQCGNVAADETKLCHHIKYYKNNYFYDDNGIRRIVAELCGNVEDKNSCVFVDASWVAKPAFEGAVLRNIIEPTEDVSEKLIKYIGMPSFEAQPGMILRAASQAARSLLQEIQAADEAPADAPAPDATPTPPKKESLKAAPPADDTDFPETPSGGDSPLKLDEPQPDTGSTPAPETPPGAYAPLGGAPAGDATAPTPERQVEEPPEDATADEVEQMMTKNILNKIRRNILKDEIVQKTNPSDRPLESESTNSGLIKDASEKDRVIKLAKATGNERLVNGLQILSNINNWKNFKKYGYSKEDVLGLLYYIDKNASDSPVKPDSVKAMSKMISIGKTASVDPQSFFTELIIETGRKPTTKEAKKLLKWAKLLKSL